MFALFKWLLWFCLPSTLVLVGMLAVACWLFWRKQYRPAVVLFCLDALLTFVMLPWTSMTLGLSLERQYPPKVITDYPKADAIVLLGGGLGATRPGFPHTECYAAADRAIMAFRLWKAGKAPVIIPTGEMAAISEKPLLEMFGVPASAILCEDRARDTAENANYTYKMLAERKCKQVFLATSAWHLPRSMMLFQYPNITFIPVSCDTEASLTKAQWSVMPLWQKLPSFQSGTLTMAYAKEWLGILFYSLRKPTAVTP
ncbi:MAG: YdcF family protein [Kiritimatiellae bacterium]|nr:YdcF family protein [Kiritimatiellia bacterium]